MKHGENIARMEENILISYVTARKNSFEKIKKEIKDMRLCIAAASCKE